MSRYQKGKTRKVKTNLDLLEQEIVSGSIVEMLPLLEFLSALLVGDMVLCLILKTSGSYWLVIFSAVYSDVMHMFGFCFSLSL